MQQFIRKKTNNLDLIRERIIYLADNYANSRAEFLSNTNLKKGIFDRKDIKRAVSSDKISNILDSYPNINSQWLIVGKGDILRPETEDYKNVANCILVNELSEHYKNKKKKENIIPLFDNIAVAKHKTGDNLESDTIPPNYINAGDWFPEASAAMRVQEESMLPYYRPGSLVVLKTIYNKKLILPGEDYVIETSEYRVIKRLQRSENKNCWRCYSTNKEMYYKSDRHIYEPFDIAISDIVHIFRVLGTVTPKANSLF